MSTKALDLLICTLISENQDLEESRSASRKKNLGLYHKPEKNPGDKLKKNPGVRELKFF